MKLPDRNIRLARLLILVLLCSLVLTPLWVSQPAKAAANEQATAVDYPIYIVQRGDTLWAISQRYHTTVTALAQLNNIPTRV